MTTVARAAEDTAGAVGACLTLPGGGSLVEVQWAPGCVRVVLSGALRACDRYVIVDAITGSMLVGARHIEVECSDVHTAEAAVLLGLARVRGFVEFTGGSFSVQGLGAELASAWRTLEP